MLTGVDFQTCSICKKGFTAAKTLHTHPYQDYKCKRCGWFGIVCDTCSTSKECPKCGGVIVSTHDDAPVDLMY